MLYLVSKHPKTKDIVPGPRGLSLRLSDHPPSKLALFALFANSRDWEVMQKNSWFNRFERRCFTPIINWDIVVVQCRRFPIVSPEILHGWTPWGWQSQESWQSRRAGSRGGDVTSGLGRSRGAWGGWSPGSGLMDPSQINILKDDLKVFSKKTLIQTMMVIVIV